MREPSDAAENKKKILDACCGSRMCWYDPHDDLTIYMDNRELDATLCDGRALTVAPDVVGDFRNMPFADGQFRLVLFDPPHLIRAGEQSWLAVKYGKLDKDTWRNDLRKGFEECLRVLEPYGVLIFKWNEDQVRICDVVRLCPVRPLFGQVRGKTHWLVFIKRP